MFRIAERLAGNRPRVGESNFIPSIATLGSVWHSGCIQKNKTQNTTNCFGLIYFGHACRKGISTLATKSRIGRSPIFDSECKKMRRTLHCTTLHRSGIKIPFKSDITKMCMHACNIEIHQITRVAQYEINVTYLILHASCRIGHEGSSPRRIKSAHPEK